MDGSTYFSDLGSRARAGAGSVAPAPRGVVAAVAAGRPSLPDWGASLTGLCEWLHGLRAAGVRQGVPALVLAFEDLRRSVLPAERRIAVLRLLKSAVLKVCKALPKPMYACGSSPGGGRPVAAGPVVVPRSATLEQRLYRLMFQNLHQALIELDACRRIASPSRERERRWLVHNLFRFCARQLRYAALWSCPLPSDTWRDLHDLHGYLVRRAGIWSVGPSAQRLRQVDPGLEYKALLLFGLAGELAPGATRRGAVIAGLAGWARQTVLEEPRARIGETGLHVVEVGADKAPFRTDAPLSPECRGWVLGLPAAFLGELEGDRTDRPEPLRWSPACLPAHFAGAGGAPRRAA